MPLLSREQVLSCKDYSYEDVPVPELAGGDPEAKIRIRSAGGRGYDLILEEYEQLKIAGKRYFPRELVVSLCAINEDGSLMFTEEDLQVLGDKSPKVLERLYKTALELSGITPRSKEEIGKNS